MKRHAPEYTFRARATALLLITGALAGLTPGAAQEAPQPFVALRVPRDGRLSAAERERALTELARQQADPQHLVVLIHGWDTPLYQSAEQYAAVAPVARAEFARLGERAAVLGLQWDSDTGARRQWLPAALGSRLLGFLGFKNAIRDPYTSRVPMARAVGRLGLRQLLFDARERFPGIRTHLLAHSMGAETVVHALDPGFTPAKPGRTFESHLPGRPLDADLVVLAGADLDYDIQAQARPGSRDTTRPPGLLWITLPKIGSRKDKILSLRKKARGKPALGNSVPKFRGEQYDDLISNRRLVYDTIDIPSDHKLVLYFGEGRLRRIAAAAATLRDPAHARSPLLTHLDQVLAAPDNQAALAPHLLGGETAPKIYALWRLERLLCGSSAHMGSGYSEKVLARTLRDPSWWDEERRTTDCKVVREGLWPPSDVVARSREAAARRQSAEPVPDDTRAFFTHPHPTGPF